MTAITDWISESVPEAVMDKAAAWVARLDSEQCDAADLVAFARWLGEEPRHRWAFQDLSEVWARLRTLSDIGPMLDDPKVVKLPAPVHAETQHHGTPHRDWSAAAISVILLVGFALNASISTPVQHHSTGAGEIVDVELADGSRLELNAKTRLEVRIDDRNRKIDLLSGEAVFHVAQDERPFVVATDRGVVSARGTSFAVESSADRLEVAVLEGSVSVRSDIPHQPLNEYDREAAWWFTGQPALLAAGDFASVTPEALNVEAASDQAMRQMLSWRDGAVEFQGQTLSAVVAEMRRYVDLNVHIADGAIGQSLVSATFAAGDRDAYVAGLSGLGNVNLEWASADWVVLRPAGNNSE